MHLDEISLDKSGRLCIACSEPDQGGTLLLLRFYLAHPDLQVPGSAGVVLESGYRHWDHLTSRPAALLDVPEDIRSTVVEWLAAQSLIAHAAGKPDLVTTLTAHASRIGRP